MKWLITGGAGYIGSHVTQAIVDSGDSAVVFDSLISGTADRVNEFAPVEIGDIHDLDKVKTILIKYKIDGIIHLAAKKSVEESMRIPKEYEYVNYLGTQNLLNAAKDCGVGAFLFSSSAAVYGNPNSMFVDEQSPTLPISPYGKTKLSAEKAVEAFVEGGILRASSLRYFNVAGAGSKKMSDTSKSNLIPIVLDAIARNQQPQIFGNEYPTKDGTCIRDYVHVQDVANAHVVIGKALFTHELPRCFNIGTGIGYSVQEVMEALIRESNSNLQPAIVGARTGDPASLVANVSLVKKALNFTAKRNLIDIVRSTILHQT